MPTDPIDRLRRLCVALPEVTERLSHGGKKVFVTTSDHHHDDRVGFWCAAPPGAQEVLTGAESERFFRPKYVGHRGWLGVYLDVPQDWDQIADLVRDAYREVAPKRLLNELDAQSNTRPARPEALEGPSGATTPVIVIR
jgi:predicted DNA-binding protein (MmcQ/YjbR family)